MKYFTLKANWNDSGSEIEASISQYWSNQSIAILYNTSPGYEDVFIATNDSRVIAKLSEYYNLKEIEPFNYNIKLISDESRTWGCKGNRTAFGF